MNRKKILGMLALFAASSIALSAASCTPAETSATTASETTVTEVTTTSTAETSETETSETEPSVSETSFITADDITVNEEISSSEDSEHAIEVSGGTASYSNIKVTKTGDSDEGDKADFYGDNSAIFATDGAELTLTNIIVDTDGKHANAVFSYGEGTTVTISDSVITTSGNCSGGLMTTGGGTTIASDLNIHTTGNSSAAIRSDRGGGTVIVTGGSYVTDGKGSPVIYSTADITVSDAVMESTSSQGIVIEGRNSVALNNVTLTADNNSKNSNKSEWFQAVMIYQSMSGDAKEGLAVFTMEGGSLTNKNGDIFFVNNTRATITITNAEIVNLDESGVFLRAAAAGWGSEGKNGGKVNLYLNNQTLEGDIIVDSISMLNMNLASGTVYSGAVNADDEGDVYVTIDSGSKWILTGDSYISSLTCDAGAIDLNGHTLYIDGEAYNGGASSGTMADI
ncbi:MAG: hypothetical protein IKF09_03470 [Clostridiales bacterium]|nr:hypothetical protein [Clostridiales bacterium]